MFSPTKHIPGVPTTENIGSPPPPRKPALVLQPKTFRYIKNGVNLIANAIRPTLGPIPRLVALEALNRTDRPELLDDGATIARRIIQIRPRGWDIGAMLLRQALWQMHVEVGDGAATTAVMYQVIVNEGIRHITQFGANAMLLRSGLEKGQKAALNAIHQQARPVIGRQAITEIARGMCQGDDELAEMLGEIFDIVGAEGLIIVESWNKWGLDREYIEGTYWELSGWFSRHFVTDPIGQRTIFEDAAILISDLELNDPALLVPVLEKCVKAGVQRLVILAKKLSESVIGLLVSNNRAKTIETMVVRTPRTQEMVQVAAMEDIAVLTGGKVFYSAAFKAFDHFSVSELGTARRVWATESQFGLFGGRGDPRMIRGHITHLRGMLQKVELESEKEFTQRRLGRMMGGTAILRVSGATDTEREARKILANRTVAGVRQAVLGGVVPGGGIALLNAQSALTCLPANHEDEAIALKILGRALEEPLRAIAKNAGYQPDLIAEKVKTYPTGWGLDATTGNIVDMNQAKIFDALRVVEKVLEVAVSSAALALTTDVIVHHAKPVESLEP